MSLHGSSPQSPTTFPALTMAAPFMAVASEEQFMGLGMRFAGSPNWNNHKEEVNVDVFITHYGACPTACKRIWYDLQTAADPNVRVGARDSPMYLLLALRYLKAYPKESELCGFFGINSRRTIKKWRDLYVDKLAKLLKSKVRMKGVWHFVVPCSWFLVAPHMPLYILSL